MSSVKRRRISDSPAPHPALKSLKAAISLSATLDLPPTQFAALLESLAQVQRDLSVGNDLSQDVKLEQEGAEDNYGTETKNVAVGWPGIADIGGIGMTEKVILQDFIAGKKLMDSVGIIARPYSADGQNVDLRVWEIKLPGIAGTVSEGALYRILVTFSDDYPRTIPKCQSSPPLFHPNVYPSGTLSDTVALEPDSLEWPVPLTRVALYKSCKSPSGG